MTNFDELRESHNRLAGRYASHQDVYLAPQTDKDDKNAVELVEVDEDNSFHYIAFVPVGGYMWELDGLQPAPIRLSSYNGSDWLSAFRQEIASRIETYSTDEDGFVLLAITQDPISILLNEQQQLQAQVDRGEFVDPEEIRRVERELESELRERAREQLEAEEKTADFRPFLNRFIELLHARGKV
ncbi:ubiquitin carboxyl-terminal hydrolase [Actinomortierella wolfii]|nr:ubiquitin carboxyl-terminal hydrolase [Actinomortierella wolfii]